MTPITPVVPGLDLPVTEFAKSQPEYNTLPALYLKDQKGLVLTRWTFSDEERKAVVEGGDIWLSQYTFGAALQPVRLTAQCPVQPLTEESLNK